MALTDSGRDPSRGNTSTCPNPPYAATVKCPKGGEIFEDPQGLTLGLRPVKGGPTSVATGKDECKKGGWADFTRADGSSFKNQGDCIQYVNTGK